MPNSWEERWQERDHGVLAILRQKSGKSGPECSGEKVLISEISEENKEGRETTTLMAWAVVVRRNTLFNYEVKFADNRSQKTEIVHVKHIKKFVELLAPSAGENEEKWDVSKLSRKDETATQDAAAKEKAKGETSEEGWEKETLDRLEAIKNLWEEQSGGVRKEGGAGEKERENNAYMEE